MTRRLAFPLLVVLLFPAAAGAQEVLRTDRTDPGHLPSP